ncbi:MAG: lamin tail domain-containing protein [Bacteroidales bacterium]
MNKHLLLICICLITVFSAKGQHFTPIFVETFANYSSGASGGGFFAEATKLTLDQNADNKTGWSQFQCYESERALKMGDKVNPGRVTTPVLSFGDGMRSTLKVNFKAQPWASDTIDIWVMIDGVEASKQTVRMERGNVVDRTLAPYEVVFEDVADNASVTFKSTKDTYARFFITEIEISRMTETPADHLLLSSYWLDFGKTRSGSAGQSSTLQVRGYGLPSELPASDLQHFTIEKTGQSAENISYDIHFTPTAAGVIEEKLIFTMGESTRTILLKGGSFLVEPQVTEATQVTSGGFTCNWEAQQGVDEIHLKAYTLENDVLQAEDLFFSKYVEGYSNNRGLEVFNGTGKPVFLGDYRITMQENGSGSLEKYSFDFPDVYLESGKSYSLMDSNSKLTDAKNAADTIIGYPSPCKILYFTGNDALFLRKNGTIIDMIGEENNEKAILQDMTIYRKTGVYSPARKFYPQQWTYLEKDYAEGFGSHAMDATGAVRKYIADVVLDASATSHTVENAQENTTYYYTIKVVSAAEETAFAPLAEVTTSVSSNLSGIQQGAASLQVEGNMLVLNLTTSQRVQVFRTNGSSLFNRTLPTGNQMIRIEAAGIYLVRCGEQTFKVIIK